MALDSNTIWGKQIADAVKTVGITDGTPVTDIQLEAFWAAVVQIHTDQLGKADVAPGAFLDSLSAPVTGIGGPVT